jgi:hypothetical protein
MPTLEQGWDLVVVFGVITFIISTGLIAWDYWDRNKHG